MKLLIGIIGEPSAGKDTAANLLVKLLTRAGYRAKHLEFSDVLYETAKLWSLPFTRDTFQKIVLGMRDRFGPEVLVQAVQGRLAANSDDVVILGGVRWPTDVVMLRDFPANFLIYITADARVRYIYSCQRRGASGKTNEAGQTFEQFMAAELVATETHIKELGSKADVRIDNEEGDVEHPNWPAPLMRQLTKVVNEQILPKLPRKSWLAKWFVRLRSRLKI